MSLKKIYFESCQEATLTYLKDLHALKKENKHTVASFLK